MAQCAICDGETVVHQYIRVKSAAQPEEPASFVDLQHSPEELQQVAEGFTPPVVLLWNAPSRDSNWAVAGARLHPTGREGLLRLEAVEPSKVAEALQQAEWPLGV